MNLTTISVAFGGLLLLAVIFKYLQKDGIQNVTMSCFFTLFGFALLASPAWDSIRIKSSNTELQLIKEAAQQMDDYARILDQYDNLANNNQKWLAKRSGAAAELPKHPDKQTVKPSNEFKALAESLRQQKERIENAISNGNLDLALTETQSSTRLIESIANSITKQ